MQDGSLKKSVSGIWGLYAPLDSHIYASAKNTNEKAKRKNDKNCCNQFIKIGRVSWN